LLDCRAGATPTVSLLIPSRNRRAIGTICDFAAGWIRLVPATSSSSSGWGSGQASRSARTRARAIMYHGTRISLPMDGECAEEADMSLGRHCRYVGGIGSVVAACALVLSGCGGNGGDDGPNTNTNGTETNTTDDTTTLTRPPTTATTIENSA
jgi:hypothetical protein